MRLRPSWLPQAQPTATSAAFDSEIVIYCERSERMHCLDRSASIVWALCDGTREIPVIVKAVAKITGTDPESVRGDVASVLEEFRHLGILR